MYESASAFWRQTLRREAMSDVASIVSQLEAFSDIVSWCSVWRRRAAVFPCCDYLPNFGSKSLHMLFTYHLVGKDYHTCKVKFEADFAEVV